MVGRQRSLTTGKRAVTRRKPVRPRRTATHIGRQVPRKGRAETSVGNPPPNRNRDSGPKRSLRLAMEGTPGLEPGIFTLDEPKEIARVLKRSAEGSGRPDSQRFATMLLAYYAQRTGPDHSEADKKRFEAVRLELRKLYGHDMPKRPTPKRARAA